MNVMNLSSSVEITSSQALAELDKVSVKAKSSQQNLDHMTNSSNTSSTAFAKLGEMGSKAMDKIDKYVKRGAIVLGGLAGAFVTMGIKANASLETSTASWETLLGTQEKAKKMMKDITKYAATTPFSKSGVDAMAKQLNNAGFEGEKLFAQLDKFGNMGSAFGVQEDSLREMVRQYSQVQMATIAYTEDLNILQDRGIPIFKALAEVTGKSVAEVKKMAGEGKISADIYNQAIDSIAKNTEGAMDKQSKTFSGLVSTLKDNLTNISQQILKPLFEKIVEVMPKFVELFDKISQGIDDGKGSMEAIKDAIGEVFGEDTLNKIERIKNIILILAGAYITLKTVMGIANLINAVNGAMQALGLTNTATAVATTGAAGAQTGLNLAWLASPITWIVGGIMLLIGAIVLLWNKSETFRNDVMALWDTITGAFTKFDNFLTNIFSTDWSTAFGSFGNVINAFLVNVKGVWDSIKRIFSGIIDFIGGVFSGDWDRAWEGVKKIFSGIMDGLGAAIKAPLNIVIGLINGAIQGINDAISFQIPDWIPGLGGKGFTANIPKISYLENGGILTQPTMLNSNVMAGEKNKGKQSQTEVVIPLDELRQWIYALATRPSQIYLSPKEIADATKYYVKNELDRLELRNVSYQY